MPTTVNFAFLPDCAVSVICEPILMWRSLAQSSSTNAPWSPSLARVASDEPAPQVYENTLEIPDGSTPSTRSLSSGPLPICALSSLMPCTDATPGTEAIRCLASFEIGDQLSWAEIE